MTDSLEPGDSAHEPLRGKPRNRGQLWALAVGFVVLFVGLALHLAPRTHAPANSRPLRDLAAAAPTQLAGWQVRDEPLGSTESAMVATKEILGFDSYVHRRYSRGELSFTIYVAYWARGKMPVRLVASHTPDRCWTANGMRCSMMRFREVYQVNGSALVPAEYRVFTTAGGGEVHVAYWHLVDGEPYDYGRRFNDIPHVWLWCKDAFRQIWQGEVESPEQVFIRVTSEMEFGRLWRDVDFQKVVSEVASLGLWCRPNSP